RIKHYILLAASIVFYALFDVKYVSVLLGVTLLSYLVALKLVTLDGERQKKGYLISGIVIIIALLVFFKFWNYLFIVAGRLFGGATMSPSDAVRIIAPIGISFFTLEAIGYMIDVYRGNVPAERDFFKYALFISFFPKVMSGPIERSTNLLKQIREGVTFDYAKVKKSFLLILWGCFMKLLIANRLAVIVDAAFGSYNEQTGFTMLIAVIIYGIQLYVDFAGYSYIAIGLAGAFGYDLMDNFIQPYFALNVRDFWRRWHVSLSSWLRDYVYISLGGSRRGNIRRYVNLMVTFFVSGLWHGTGLHFVVWGLLHGVYQVISASLNKNRKQSCDNRFSSRLVKAVITFALVDFAWLFFRADSVGSALEIVRKMVLHPEVGRTIFDGLCLAGVEIRKGGLLAAELLLLLLVDICHEKKLQVSDWIDRQDKWFRWCVYLTMALFIIIGMVRDYGIDASTFIYANF
ncbi:MAG: MBOAT family protein, partial [Butyrivibrio sp.]|nr:MBOAT family protein [Butyrivibrio sp.]